MHFVKYHVKKDKNKRINGYKTQKGKKYNENNINTLIIQFTKKKRTECVYHEEK